MGTLPVMTLGRFTLAVVFGGTVCVALWLGDTDPFAEEANVVDTSDKPIVQYDPDKAVFAYSKSFAESFGLDPEKAYDFPEPILAIRAYVADTPLGKFVRQQFYIDSKLHIHLPSNAVVSKSHETSYTGFWGFNQEDPAYSTDLEREIRDFVNNNMPFFMWQFIAAEKDLETGEVLAGNLAISRYTTKLIPNMTLIETNTTTLSETHIYLYIGKDKPTMSKSALMTGHFSDSQPISEQVRSEFLEVKLPKNIRDFLAWHYKYRLENY